MLKCRQEVKVSKLDFINQQVKFSLWYSRVLISPQLTSTMHFFIDWSTVVKKINWMHLYKQVDCFSLLNNQCTSFAVNNLTQFVNNHFAAFVKIQFTAFFEINWLLLLTTNLTGFVYHELTAFLCQFYCIVEN